MRPIIITTVLVAGAVVACGGEELTACESAMSAAADVSDLEDTVEDLDPAVRACATFAEFEAAADRFPDALDGAPADLFVANRCADGVAADICAEVDR